MIEITNLQYIYSGNKDLTIKDISFRINKGEIFGFLGPSGAGKSTTQKIVIGILKDYHGSVKINKTELKHIGREYYQNIGVSFEFPNLYTKLTALENLQFFQSLYSGETIDPMNLLSIVGLADDAMTRVDNFSKGMKMRLNFCRALINNPDILFLDEPTSGLDPVNQKNIRKIIKEEKEKGKTIFLTTHNMNVADELCDRVGFLVDGKLVSVDSPRELKLQHNVKKLKVEYSTSNSIISKEFSMKDLGKNREFITLLKQNEIETIHSQESTLEDVFIKTTGQELK